MDNELYTVLIDTGSRIQLDFNPDLDPTNEKKYRIRNLPYYDLIKFTFYLGKPLKKIYFLSGMATKRWVVGGGKGLATKKKEL